MSGYRDFRSWEKIEDIPPEVLGVALSVALRMPSDPESLGRISEAVEEAAARAIRTETARLIVLTLRMEIPGIQWQAAERAAGLISCLSHHTVNDVVRGRRAYAKAS